MRLPRCLSVVKASMYEQGMTKGWLRKKPEGKDVAVAIKFSMRVSPSNPTAADKTMTKRQLLEHSRGSGLDHEHRLLSGVPLVCELGAFSCVVGCIRRESVCCGG